MARLVALLLHALSCHDRAVADSGVPASTSHISNMVLSIVKSGGAYGIRTRGLRLERAVS